MILTYAVNRNIYGIDNIYNNLKTDKKCEVYGKKKINEPKEAKKKENNKKLQKTGEKRFVILSKYNIFFKNIQPSIMNMYPGIENRERMGKIGIEWRKHNAIIANIKAKYVQHITWVINDLY